MKFIKVLTWAMWSLAFTVTALPGLAADYPAPKEGSWVVRDFRFHTGEVLPELRLHYTTVGAPTGEPVLILHGTTQSGASMLSPVFGGELFGPGQPLDATRYYVILPDAIGHGKSSKPSDGSRTSFPKYLRPVPQAPIFKALELGAVVADRLPHGEPAREHAAREQQQTECDERHALHRAPSNANCLRSHLSASDSWRKTTRRFVQQMVMTLPSSRRMSMRSGRGLCGRWRTRTTVPGCNPPVAYIPVAA
jgi:hypothetical protein